MVIDAISIGVFHPGDFLICDNAKVHGGLDTIAELYGLLQAVGVILIYLPTYSPELNPCELVFAFIKNQLRNYRDSDLSLLTNVIKILSTLPCKTVRKWYVHCKYYPFGHFIH